MLTIYSLVLKGMDLGTRLDILLIPNTEKHFFQTALDALVWSC